MSCSKLVPPFVYDSLYYLNREQLERFSIVCRPLKNFIHRYLHSKPYRIFDRLGIHGGSYALVHNDVHWHPNRDDYNVHQFLAGEECIIDKSKVCRHATFYSFAEMLPYLAPNVRVNWTIIAVTRNITYNPEHVAEMESIAYLWRDGDIYIPNLGIAGRRIVAEDIQLILNSPIILQCREFRMTNVYFSLKDYKVWYNVKVIVLEYDQDDGTDSNYWRDFLEQPGYKPIVGLHYVSCELIDKALDLVKEAFSAAVLPNAFKVVFIQYCEHLIEFRETNKTSGEKLELKKGLLVEYQERDLKEYHCYTLERSAI